MVRFDLEMMELRPKWCRISDRTGVNSNGWVGPTQRLLQQITATADAVIKPDNLIWVVVSDREKIESRIRGLELELGEITLLDHDGNELRPTVSI